VPLTDHIALVSLTREIPTRDLLRAAAAVQKQLTRDFTPIWGIRATLDTFEDLESVPSDYHPVVVFGQPDELIGRIERAIGPRYTAELVDGFERGKLTGLHTNAFTRQPFSLVHVNEGWTVTLSHEVLEMTTDPYGNRLIAAAHPLYEAERVKYLLEVCDPCQNVWYPVNGIPVSDFYTPRYFEPVEIPGGRYSFTGEIVRPLQIIDGGYLSWVDPEDSALYTLAYGETVPTQIANLSELPRSATPLRTVVDTSARSPRITAEALRPAKAAKSARTAFDAVTEASEGAGRSTTEAVFSLATGAG
jgi:hypothetical protein